ncbi:hypothetical protein BGW41_000684 [Actinomortierella wolfii]|nr:hypothetical protein BGW41_000684 [Actinomortierella wolfii]
MEPYDHGTTRQSETHGYQSSSSSPLHPNAHHSSRYSVHAHHTSSHPSQYGVEDQYGRHPSQSIPSSPPLYHQGLLEDHRSSLSSSLPRHSDYSSYSHLQQQQQQQHQSQSLGFSHHPDYGYPTHASPPPSSHPNHHHHHSLPPPQRRTSPSPQYAGYPHTSGSDYPHHVRQQSSQSYVSTPTSRSHHNGLQRIDTRPDITGVSSSSMPGPSLPVSPPSSSSSSSTSMSTTAAGMLGGGGSPVSSRGAAATATTSPDTSSPMNMMNVVSRHLTENPPRRRRRPNESYSNIIIKAIWNSEHKRLKLSEIYEYVKKELPQSQFGDDKGWQNTVRHNLSLNPCFRRETAEEAAARSPTSPTEDYDEAAGSSKGKQTKPAKRGKGGYWVLDMDELDENLKPKKYASDQQPQQQQQNQQSQRSQPQSPQQPPQQQVERLQENSLEGNERRPIQSACASISRSMTNNSSNSSGSAAEGRTREGGVRKTATSAYSTGMSTSHLMDIDSEVVSVVQSETPSTTTHNPGSVMAENEIWRQSYSAGNESRRQSQSDNASDRSMCSDIEDGDEEDEVVDDDEDDIETDKGDEDMKQDSLELEPWPSTAGRVDAIGSSSWESRRSNLHHHGRGAMSLVSLLNPVGDSTDELYNDNH